MEIQNLQTIRMGEGKEMFEAFLTLDLIPFHLIIRYNFTKRDIDFGWGKGGVYESPTYIKNFYTVEVYQQVIDLICDKYRLEKRQIISIGRHRELKTFDFRNDTYCMEYQYDGSFGMTFYTKTKIQNALKSYEQWVKTFSDRDKLLRNYNDDFCKMSSQIDTVIKHLKNQKVFTNRDFIDLSHATVERFIENFKMKAK